VTPIFTLPCESQVYIFNQFEVP